MTSLRRGVAFVFGEWILECLFKNPRIHVLFKTLCNGKLDEMSKRQVQAYTRYRYGVNYSECTDNFGAVCKVNSRIIILRTNEIWGEQSQAAQKEKARALHVSNLHLLILNDDDDPKVPCLRETYSVMCRSHI